MRKAQAKAVNNTQHTEEDVQVTEAVLKTKQLMYSDIKPQGKI